MPRTTRQIDAIVEAKGLPSSLESERLTLGALLSDPAAQPIVMAELDPVWLTTEAHVTIFGHARRLFDAGQSLDRVTLAQSLMDSGALEKAGGLSYLMDLDRDSPQALNVDGYLRVLRRLWVRRQAIVSAYAVIQAAMTGEDEESITGPLEKYLELAQPQESHGLISAADHVREVGVDALFAPDAEKGEAIHLPFPKLSAMAGALLPKQMTVLSAPTGAGKSSLARQIIISACRASIGVALFSMEMSRDEVLTALACTIAGVDSRRIAAGTASHAERSRLMAALGEVEGWPLFIDEASNTTSAIDARMRQLCSRRSIGLLVVDHFHLLADAAESRNVAQATQANRLRAMIRRLNLHAVVLAQYSKIGRRSQKDDGPQTTDIEGSEALSQAAHRIWMLDPQKLPDGEAWPERLPYMLYIRKARGGGLGQIPFGFERRFTRFVEDEISLDTV